MSADRLPEADRAILVEHYRIHDSDPDAWTRKALLGRGAFGDVWLEENAAEGKTRAVKTVVRRDHRPQRVNAEVLALVNLSQPRYRDHFGEFLGFLEDGDKISFFMEFFPKGDLRQHLPEGDTLSESQCKTIARQILRGVHVMHEQKFTHRDLKPENVFVVNKDPWRVKIGDFGVAKRVRDEHTLLQTTTGTRPYMAPEIFLFVSDPNQQDGHYTNRVDVWSLGVILFEMLTGQRPFPTHPVLKAYCESRYTFPGSLLEINNVSAEGVSFVQRLLSIKPTDRPSAAEALQNPWLNEPGSAAPSPYLQQLSNKVAKKFVSDASRPWISHEASQGPPQGPVPRLPVRSPRRPPTMTMSSSGSDFNEPRELSRAGLANSPRSDSPTLGSPFTASPILDSEAPDEWIDPKAFPLVPRELQTGASYPDSMRLTLPHIDQSRLQPTGPSRGVSPIPPPVEEMNDLDIQSGKGVSLFPHYPERQSSVNNTQRQPPQRSTRGDQNATRTYEDQADVIRQYQPDLKTPPQTQYSTRQNDKQALDYSTDPIVIEESQDSFKELSPNHPNLPATGRQRQRTLDGSVTRSMTMTSDMNRSIMSSTSFNEEIPNLVSQYVELGQWKLGDSLVFAEVRNWDLVRISALTIRSVTPVKLDEFHHKNYEEDLPANVFKELQKDWLKRQFAGSAYAKSLNNKNHISQYTKSLKEDVLSKFDPTRTDKEFYSLKLPFSHADEGSTEYLKKGEVLIPFDTVAKCVEAAWKDWLAHYVYGFIRDEKIPWANPVRAIIFDQPNAKATERVEFFDKYLRSMIKDQNIELLNLEGFKHYVDKTKTSRIGKRLKSDESVVRGDSAYSSRAATPSPATESKWKKGFSWRS
ncbi:hypothetical protein MBLNU457_1297t1 [Dothideomycetes sp. NU457]